LFPPLSHELNADVEADHSDGQFNYCEGFVGSKVLSATIGGKLFGSANEGPRNNSLALVLLQCKDYPFPQGFDCELSQMV